MAETSLLHHHAAGRYDFARFDPNHDEFLDFAGKIHAPCFFLSLDDS
jgi:hypothetical protein